MRRPCRAQRSGLRGAARTPGLLRDCPGTPLGFLRDCPGIPSGLPRDCSEIPPGILWALRARAPAALGPLRAVPGAAAPPAGGARGCTGRAAPRAGQEAAKPAAFPRASPAPSNSARAAEGPKRCREILRAAARGGNLGEGSCRRQPNSCGSPIPRESAEEAQHRREHWAVTDVVNPVVRDLVQDWSRCLHIYYKPENMKKLESQHHWQGPSGGNSKSEMREGTQDIADELDERD